MSERRPAEGFPPAAYIEEELVERGKDRSWLLKEAGRDSGAIADLVAGVMQGKRMTIGAATALSRVFGTSAQLWVNLDAAWWSWLEHTLEKEAASGKTGRETRGHD